MHSNRPDVSIGVDFGTSNTVVALATPDGVETVRFAHGDGSLGVYASALCFWQERRGLPPLAEGGPWAFDRLIDPVGALRFLQSFKTLAASPHFTATTIFGQRHTFEDLLAAFLRTLTRHSGLALSSARVTIGRPVRFAGASPDEALAMQRYRDGFARVGVEGAAYVYEPVGAAFSFARGLEGEATVLVADFGGGTSDFSLMRFTRKGGALKAEPLGQAGVGVAGDTFDSRLIDKVVAPHFGKGGSYRSFGKVLPMPAHLFAKLSRWHELALLKGGADMRELLTLARDALDPEPLEAFIDLVERDLGFALYRAVSAVKVALSGSAQAEFRFEDVRETVTRADFESWIAGDLKRIAAAVDQAMATAGLRPNQVNKVFLTGGTSFVPAVQSLFAERFGRAKLTAADQFESIALGLALIGRTDNPEQWSVAA
jgi:hypothetical chaperone protein